MQNSLIDSVLHRIFFSQWLVILVVVPLLAGLAELGFRFGRRLHQRKDQARKEHIGGTMGAILGMLGLLIGFTFAMAVARYDARRKFVMQEANAIGTTWLRASFLPPPHQEAVENLLKAYTDARLAFHEAEWNPENPDASLAESSRLQREIWAHAVAAVKLKPDAPTTSFVNALNEMIDLQSSRLHALRSHVPGAVWILVLIVAGCGAAISGYHAGASGVRSAFPNFLFPLLIAVVITLLADLDRSRGGVIDVSQQPFLDLRKSLTPIPPAGTLRP